MSRREPRGSLATLLKVAPNGTLILARALTAQPLASRIGPRLRLRSLMYARTTDGIEMSSMIPTKAATVASGPILNSPVA